MSDTIIRHAVISPCDNYRYLLIRRWDRRKMLTWIMLNPSRADADRDDPTVRRCMGLARREGYGGIRVLNLFAWRSPHPSVLADVENPEGPDNRDYLDLFTERSRQDGTPVVAAWGGSIPPHHAGHLARQTIVYLTVHREVRLTCLGRTATGEPRHPLFVLTDQPFEDYT